MIINNQTYGDVWQSCLSRIREHTSDEEFAKWFKPIVPLDFDGVTLKVYIENPKVKSGGEVHITATVTNNSGKDIISTLPIYNQQHYEIRTKILTQGGKAFYDKDYPVEMTEDATRRFIVKSGESYVQDMYLVAAEMNSGVSMSGSRLPRRMRSMPSTWAHFSTSSTRLVPVSRP